MNQTGVDGNGSVDPKEGQPGTDCGDACVEFVDNFEAFFRGDVEGELKTRMELHLSKCLYCRWHFNALPVYSGKDPKKVMAEI